MITKLHELADLGQSIWLDTIRRSLIASGELQSWIDKGLRGVTSNPSIFQKAIAGSADYDQALRELVAGARPAAGPRGASVGAPATAAIYEALVLEDIARAADLLRPVYDRTAGLDGYVSLEADPRLAHDAAGTIVQVRRFARTLNRPNVMFKVPATPAGMQAIATLIGEGIPINVTLIFGLAQYEAVAEAYIAGLEQLAAAGGDLRGVASVASFFVSRVDTAVDRALEALGDARAGDLRGQIAVANARVAYTRFRQILAGQGSLGESSLGERWPRLAAQGARPQRLLWASTSTKNPLYPDTLYIDSLIGPHTVNTVPPDTLQLFLDHGTVAPTLEAGGCRMDEACDRLARLEEWGIDLKAIAQQLLDDGVAQFVTAFEGLAHSIAEKCDRLLAGWVQLSASLGDLQSERSRPAVDATLAAIKQNRIMARIWEHDHTVWKDQPDEIANRLGWLHVADQMLDNLACLEALADDLRAEGYTHALLLGMGGSSLAPEVLRKTFGVRDGYLDLAVLDSTDPAAVLSKAKDLHAGRLGPARTLFIVSTKSGDTAETLSFFTYFYNWTADAVGQEEAGRHFVAITDPGTGLAGLAREYGFRACFLNDPHIGGRYSALSYVGLVPAALIGLDMQTLLDRALTMACNCQGCNCPVEGDNAGALLGAIVGTLARDGRDRLTLIASPPIASLGDWVEQLIAESTGKEGTGILPVVGEPLGAPEVYGPDRLFVYLRLDGDGDPSAGSGQAGPGQAYDAAVQALQDAGHPVVHIHLRDPYDLGQQFFLWEMATAVASHVLGVNPFNQPNVEAAKDLARDMADEYKRKGQLPEGESLPPTGEALQAFLAQARPGSYIALQAYVQPTAETDAALLALRTHLRDRYRLATTVGYGPRFLHSTGQLHKGDAGNGLFIQFTTDDPCDVPIPDQAGSADSSITFGVLKAVQALGDYRALQDAGRQVVRFHLGSDAVAGLKRLADAL